ncbi:MAG: response regulator transcription factor [Magnetococcales bacterium]|nr:response regulator transcription factor [Magnetococcales bacterium]
MRLLLVEDDTLLGDGIRTGLAQEGYTVEWLQDGEEAAQALETDRFDLLILDWNLPKLSGIEVLARLRKQGVALPVLMLTARDTVADRVRGLDGGADDYLVKPFDLEELAARIRSLLRRSHGRSSPQLENGPLLLIPSSHEVFWYGNRVDLSPREYALLLLLLENAGRVVTRERVIDTLYGWEGEAESNTLEVFVHRLRRKFDAELIRTVRGIGYVMEKH